MDATRAAKLLGDYQFHTGLIHHFVDGISHEQSLQQLPFDHNCMNWLLGHIVTNRSHVLETVGAAHEWQEKVRARYHTGTPPVTAAGDAVPFGELIAHLNESIPLLQSALAALTDDALDTLHTNYRGEKSRHAHLTGFHWHENFHIGQLEILRAFLQG